LIELNTRVVVERIPVTKGMKMRVTWSNEKKEKKREDGLSALHRTRSFKSKNSFFWITMHQSHTPPGAMLVMFQKKPGQIYTISLQLLLVNLYLFYCICRTCPDGFSWNACQGVKGTLSLVFQMAGLHLL